MPRRPRVSIPGYSEHIIQRGNNRQPIFACDNWGQSKIKSTP